MIERVRFLLKRLQERLWIRPLFACVLSLFGAFAAKWMEDTAIAPHLPSIQVDSVEALLVTLSGSMLVIATFAVGSMVSSLAAAGRNATPRTFSLVVSDDLSQNALSIFIGAFIFSLVSIVFVKNDYYRDPGLFALFVLTVITFTVVILTFVRWVDSIARLGRLGTIIDKAVAATDHALQRRRRAPRLGCGPVTAEPNTGRAITASEIGYVQRIDVDRLQEWAEKHEARIVVRALPGTFASPDRALAHVISDRRTVGTVDSTPVAKAFLIGNQRTFEEDPRFGLIVLSQIAGRALSPAVNDPGTAIDVTAAFVRLFTSWNEPVGEEEREQDVFDRVHVPELSVRDLFDDAFTAIARDGAGTVEVGTRLQKALCTLAAIGDPEMRRAAVDHSRLALERSTQALTLPTDVQTLRDVASFSSGEP